MAERWDDLARRDARFFVATREAARDQDEFLASGRDLVDVVMGWLGDSIGRRRMLEIGCGLGRTCAHFATHFDAVDGVDVSAEMIERSRETPLPDNVTLHVGTGADLEGFDDGAYDLVFSAIVFQHVPDLTVIASYVNETARVLAPGGRAVLHFDTRPERAAMRLYKALPDVLLPRTHRRYIRRYRRDADQLRAMAAAAGLTTVEEHGSGTADHYFVLRR